MEKQGSFPLKVKRWGNGAGILIPKIVLKSLNWKENNELTARIHGNEICIVKSKKRDIKSLVDQITPENIHGECSFGAPIGGEVW